MTRIDDSSPKRTTSRDGTEIAYWTSGSGPPLVLVHGAPADHTRWRPLLPFLEPHSTVHAMDRRGRGASGDGPEYHLEREFEDVVAVVDTVAASLGCAVDVYGHSFGGLCTFGAATLTLCIRRLALYDGWPLVNPEKPQALRPALGKRLDALLAEGNHEAVVETIFRELLMMSDDELAALRTQPGWPARVAAARRITREIRAISEAVFDPEQAAKITVPTLLLTGEDSPDPAAADIDPVSGALPDARIVVLEGQQHVADVLAPEVVAAHLVAFLRDER